MIRIVFLLLPLLLCSAGLRAQGQKPASPPVAATPAISAEQARSALDMLNDPKKRAAFTATLEAIVRAQAVPGVVAAAPPEPAKEPPKEGVVLPLAPDSLGAQVLVSGSAFVSQIGDQVLEAFNAVQSLPLLYGWVVVMATNPVARGVLEDASWRIALALVCAFAVEYALRRAFRRPIGRVEAIVRPQAERIAESDDWEARAEAGDLEGPSSRRRAVQLMARLRLLPRLLARLVLELAPVVGMVVVGHLIAGSILGGQTVSQLAILAVVDASALSTATLCLLRMILSPGKPALRLASVSEATAVRIMRAVRRLVLVAVFGYVLTEVSVLFGLSDIARDALQKAVGLVLHLQIPMIVLNNRDSVAGWLRSLEVSSDRLAKVRDRLASIWHWLALLLLAMGWLLWAIKVQQGYMTLLVHLLATIVVIALARFGLTVLLGGIERRLVVTPETSSRFPGIEARLHSYHPMASAVARLGVFVTTGLLLLQLYGLGPVTWLFSSTLGLRILSSAGTMGITLLLALIVWEGANAAMQGHLAHLQRDAQTARSARVRTLLPLLRTALLIAIGSVTILTVLSEIGVNIAPLLAGAGILGVAIGFGSQKLVQDLITGIFLLLENAMQVGDWVTVSGLSGTVEALSVRTIRLRAADGSVHIIPFSSVTSVTNVNRGIGNAAISVTVVYEEDTDKVVEEMKAIVAGMREDPIFAPRMLGDLQVWGVDKLDGAAVTLTGQVVCTDTGRWSVQREFNRRMKRRFQAVGIRLFNQAPA